MTTLQRFRTSLATLLGPRGGAKQGALWTLLMRVVSTGLGFATSVLLARLLGVSGYGVYAFVFAWVNLLAIPTALGMDKLMVREVAVFRARGAWGALHGFVRWGNLAVLAASLGVAALAAGVGWVVLAPRDGLRLAFVLALASLPLTTLTSLRQAAMRGFNHIVSGQWPELLLRPVLIIAFSLLAWFALPRFGLPFNAVWATLAAFAATAVAFGVGALLLVRVLRDETESAPPSAEPGRWLRRALPFMVISGMYVLNARTDVVMLGMLADTDAVGLYTPATRGAELISFVLLAVNTALSPTLARLFAEGKRAQLEAATARSTRLITLATLPLALGMVLLGGVFLRLFGPEFVAARTALVILSAGQLINAATGTVGTLLNMTGFERDTALAVGLSATLNILLNALLIPPFGINGAAAATALSTLTWNALLATFVYRRLGFYALLGVLTLRRARHASER
ncbi:flippase [Truepera radiovictrix]|uniref:Polysaccharide biosynthesis protein n=1 Tax=Truepera radiovictrix (strain DSM 17093 / CIP 108686 / LMG 22925 / RQ-24) TaxID=649638 RepID=D7CUZ7_TRURR|nr:flippase [Truepera radiovictrix]ADI15824.1 polysaccharide biosynthesis protein [Truepera radiovictrix DSM 17093]WMT58548.1 flippase [Truepera radiovictrix]